MTPTPAPPLGPPESVKARENSVDGLGYVWLPPGTFQMGCTPGDGECFGDENPRHEVKIAKGFWLGQTEVTVAAYRRFAAAKQRALPEPPSFNPGWTKADHPIVNVNWDDAGAFCEWSRGRLPSEAEWEYAARGGLDDGKYPWGNETPVDRKGARNGARFDISGLDISGPVAVGSYSVNGHGLYDMAGNVWEWCEDMWHYSYAGAPEDGTAWVTEASSDRLYRGGSWEVGPKYLRVSHRNRINTDYRIYGVGFRCVRDASP